MSVRGGCSLQGVRGALVLTVSGAVLLVVAATLISIWLLVESIVPLWPAALLLLFAIVITVLGLLVLAAERFLGRAAGNRLAVAAVLMLVAGVVSLFAAHLLTFGRIPPTYLNLVFWVPPSGQGCVEQAVSVERIPGLGTGIGLNDMCPTTDRPRRAARLETVRPRPTAPPPARHVGPRVQTAFQGCPWPNRQKSPAAFRRDCVRQPGICEAAARRPRHDPWSISRPSSATATTSSWTCGAAINQWA